MHCFDRTVAGVPMMVCGTGYTGEDGVELLIDPESAPQVWDALIERGATPAGLGARDTLRLEVCFHLYGNDLSEGRGPIEAGLGWCCKEQTGFIGAEPVARARAEGTSEKLVPFLIDGPGIARQGNSVLGGGEVTSGTFSPCLERGIGMAYVSADRAEPGTRLEIDVRGTTRSAIVERKPLYGAKRRHGEAEPWPKLAIQTICSTTQNTTGRASTATAPPSGSPGSPRMRWAKSCSSIRPPWERR